MKPEITNELEVLRPIFEAELRSSIEACVAEYTPYGYALKLGEDLDQAYPMAITNSEAELAEDDNETRYIPDEWEDWHHDHFNEFRSSFKNLFAKFSETHVVTDDDFCYSDDAVEFMTALYDLYLSSMKKVTSDFDSIWYWIIWISDSNRDVINRSFVELNSGRAAREAKEYFPDGQ